MPIGAAIGAVAGSVGGALISSSASKKAAQIQGEAANKATDVQERMFQQTREDLAPYNAVGQGALTTLANFYGINSDGTPSTDGALSAGALEAFRNSPDYQFALTEGVKGIDRSAASKGLLLSGGQLKGVTDYASGLATTNLNNYLTRLRDLAGLGENAGAQTGNLALSTGRGIADTTLAGGEAAASGVVGSANAFSSGINNVINNLSALKGMNSNPSAYQVNSFNQQFNPNVMPSFQY